jgi:hypothetical protein
LELELVSVSFQNIIIGSCLHIIAMTHIRQVTKQEN